MLINKFLHVHVIYIYIYRHVLVNMSITVCRKRHNKLSSVSLWVFFVLFCLGAVITFWLKPNQAYTSVRADLYFCRNASRRIRWRKDTGDVDYGLIRADRLST